MWDTSFTFSVRGTGFGKYPPGIHPLEVVTAVADDRAGAEDYRVARRAMNDRHPKLSGRALLRQNGYVNLAVAIKISLQLKGIEPDRAVILFSQRSLR